MFEKFIKSLSYFMFPSQIKYWSPQKLCQVKKLRNPSVPKIISLPILKIIINLPLILDIHNEQD